MKVLLIKTSSLGDVLHTLPAVTDASRAIPGIRFDWVVEESFVEVPVWHPAVERVIPVAIRRWRKSLLKTLLSGEWLSFRQALKMEQYDLVLDAQGLIKSGVITQMVKGPHYGLDHHSAREPFASRFYDHPISVAKGEHAIVRLRSLFAQVLGYPLPKGEIDSGIGGVQQDSTTRSILFVHGTTWVSKHWPDSYWLELAALVNKSGYKIVLPWGGESEKERAEMIAAASEAVVLPKCTLTELASWFLQVSAMVCVDSGLAHLGAALNIPSVTIYGSTNPGLTGTYGKNQQHIHSSFECAPCLKRTCSFSGISRVQPACYQQITPELVWRQLSDSL